MNFWTPPKRSIHLPRFRAAAPYIARKFIDGQFQPGQRLQFKSGDLGAIQTGGDPFFSSVQFLCHFDGADGSTTFTDSSSHARSIIVGGNAQIDTAQSKFGGASGLFDGNDYIAIDGEASLAYGTADFTIEGFVRRAATGATHTLIDHRPGAGGNNPYVYITGGNALVFGGFGADRITGGSLSSATWYHFAVSRVSANTRAFLDGTQVGSTYADTNNYGNDLANRPVIGANLSLAFGLNGHLDEFRITMAGRYSANFTVPTEAYPDF